MPIFLSPCPTIHWIPYSNIFMRVTNLCDFYLCVLVFVHCNVWCNKNFCGKNLCDLSLTRIIYINKSHAYTCICCFTIVSVRSWGFNIKQHFMWESYLCELCKPGTVSQVTWICITKSLLLLLHSVLQMWRSLRRPLWIWWGQRTLTSNRNRTKQGYTSTTVSWCS